MTKKISKNTIAALMAIIMVIGVTLPVLASTSPNTSNDIRVFVNGQQVIFDDQQPVIINNRTMVPVRGLFEALDYDVEWLPASRTARLERRVEHYTEIHTIDIPVDETTFTSHHWDRAPVTITPEVPQQLINGRTMLPLSAITQTMEGVDAQWDGPNRSVIITTGNGNVASPTATPVPTVSPSPVPTTSPMPTPSPSPIPVATPTPSSGFVDVNGNGPVNLTRNEWRESVESTMSDIQLPNRRLTESEQSTWRAEYQTLGGMNAFELEVVRLVNEIRVDHGLQQLVIDPVFSEAARFYAQTLTNLNLPLSHSGGPYGGPGGAPRAWGYRGAIGGNGAWGDTPQIVVNGWMNSPGHRYLILWSEAVFIGAGSFGVTTYMPIGIWDAVYGDPSVVW